MAKKLAARPTSAAGSLGAASTLRLARNQRPQASRAACDAGAEGFMLLARLTRRSGKRCEAYAALRQALWQRGAMCSPFVGYYES